MAKTDVTLPDLPQPGSDRAKWVRWAVTLALLLLNAYLTNRTEQRLVILEPQIQAVAAK